jgi:ankyrin repeat protein
MPRYSPIEIMADAQRQRNRQNLWNAIHNNDLVKISQALNNGSVIEPVHWEFATSYSPVEIVKLLVERGADVHSTSTSGNTGLHLAALLRPMAGKPEVYSVLVEAGTDVNALNRQSETALHLLCGRNAPEACLELLRLGADPSIRSGGSGKTAIELCKTAGLRENASAMIAYLQSRKALQAMDEITEPTRSWLP